MIETRSAIDPGLFGPCLYPSRPFSHPEMNKTLEALPPGFSNVALAQSLSIRCVRVLARIARWDAESKINGRSTKLEWSARVNMALGIKVVKATPSMTPNERLALIGGFAYTVFMGGDFDSWFVVNGNIQLTCKVMHKLFSHTVECDPALKLWTAVLLKTVYGPDNFSSRFADHLTASCDDREVKLVLKKKELSRLYEFFWSPSLSEALGGISHDAVGESRVAQHLDIKATL